MRVLKAINNNVISCLDDHGNELVVMGRGLGFQIRSGVPLTEDMAEKIFRMESPEEFRQLKELFAKLPPELLELCSHIVDHAGKMLGRNLCESIYLTLSDHIQFAIERSRRGIVLKNALMTEVKVFYPKEFAVGVYALSLIEREMGLQLPEDEAASIALHLVNAEYDRSMDLTMRAAQTLQPISKILENWDGLRLDRNSLCYDELLVHLKFMAMEAFSCRQRDWADITQPVKAGAPTAFACAQAVADFLARQSGHPVPPSEIAYLAISIHRASHT